MSITTLATTGDNIVSGSLISESSSHILQHRLPPLGIKTVFVDVSTPESFRDAIDHNTKAVFIESITSSKLLVVDIQTIAKIAHEAGVPVIV
jgi:O-acetylhomoserine/O-acetylserine sulfhydrylase-like pyridoxal-dependent enzyme